MAALLLKIPTLITILLLIKWALFIIHIDVNFFLFSKFSSHKGKIVESHVGYLI